MLAAVMTVVRMMAAAVVMAARVDEMFALVGEGNPVVIVPRPSFVRKDAVVLK